MAGDGVIVPVANGEITNLVQGEIVRQSVLAMNTALRALATSAAGIQGALGVVVSGDVGPGGPVFVESAGRQPVLLEGGLAPVVGQWVFVSATAAGRGTNVQPANAVPVGTILDTSTYSRDSRVLVSMPAVLLPANANQTGLISIADFNKLATVPTGILVVGGLITAEINFLAPSADNEFIPPTFAGKYFLPFLGRFIVTALDGTITTPPTTNIGNNVAKNNYRVSGAGSPSAADLNTIAGAAVLPATALYAIPVPTTLGLIDNATSVKVDVTVAATPNTASVFRGKIAMAGFWIT